MNLKRVKIFQHRELLILAIALAFLFFGWNAAEQHLTSFYQETEGQTNTALNALAILYGSIIAGNFFAPFFVRKLGIKSSIIFGFFTYILLVFGVLTKITPLIFGLSVLLGIGCSILGVAQIDFIRVFSPKNLRGELAGSINALRVIGGSLGILSVSLLARLLKIEGVYFLLGVIMILGNLILFPLKQPEPEKEPLEEKEKMAQGIQRTILMFKEVRLLLTIPLSVASGFLLGLILGAIPASVAQAYGLVSVGLVMVLFHLASSLFGFYSGKLSDKKGRFLILYWGIAAGLIANIILILTSRIFPLISAMVLGGLFSATTAVVLSALFIDLFGKKVKEAQAAGGSIGAALGVMPAFILNKYFSTAQLLYLAIFLCLLGGFSLKILEVKLRKIS